MPGYFSHKDSKISSVFPLRGKTDVPQRAARKDLQPLQIASPRERGIARDPEFLRPRIVIRIEQSARASAQRSEHGERPGESFLAPDPGIANNRQIIHPRPVLTDKLSLRWQRSG